MPTKKSRVGMSLILLLMLIAVAVAPVAAQEQTFTTTLTGAAEVPGPGDPDGRGTAKITLKENEICFELTASNIILPAIASHIHVGSAAVAGPVVVPLTPPDASGSSSGCVDVDPALIDAIRENPENYYVNVHTTDLPAGAIRGQLSRPGQGGVGFNHSSTVSVTSSERPQITLQFGNSGNVPLAHVTLTCVIDEGDASFDVNQVFANGVFPTVTTSSDELAFSGLTSLNPGQNYNVSFVVIPSGTSVIECTLDADNLEPQTATITVSVR